MSDTVESVAANMDSDTLLLQRYAKGRDAQAFAQLVQRYAGMVFSVARRITGNAHDAEDVAQACFMELARGAGTGAGAGSIRASLAGWLHSAATHRSCNRLRDETTRRRHEMQAAAQRPLIADATWDQIAPYVDLALAQLPDDLRLPLVMHFLQGLSQSEIATELEISQPTVSRRLESGVEQLREKLKCAEVYAPVALPELLTTHGLQPAPPALTESLGKMAMAGVGPAAAASVVGIKALAVVAAALVIAGAGFWTGFNHFRAPPPSPTPAATLASNINHQGANMIIQGVPPLAWGKTGETTFCGAMAAALAATDRPCDYDTLMGVSAIAFRVRWYEGPTKGDRWVGGIPVGEQDEERALVGNATGYRMESIWADKSDPARHQDQIARVIASVNAGLPVLSYVAPHMDCAVVYGYSDDKGMIFVRDYYAPDGPDAQPVEKIGPWFLYLNKHQPAISPHEALTVALRAAVRNWSRTDRPRWGFPGKFLYGQEAWDRWIADVKSFESLADRDKQQLFFVNWWNFNCMNDARRSAGHYLAKSAALFSGESSAALARAAGLYARSAEVTGQAWVIKDVPIPWKGPNMSKWTPQVRERELTMLQQAKDLDGQAIGEIQNALAAIDQDSPSK